MSVHRFTRAAFFRKRLRQRASAPTSGPRRACWGVIRRDEQAAAKGKRKRARLAPRRTQSAA